jgi:hypothetical protein
MSANALIVVTGGIHTGASVLLSDGHDLSIGSGAEAGLVLIDEGVAAHHATIRLDHDHLTLTACADGVTVFGRALRAGRSTVLRYGGSFSVGTVTLQFSDSESLTPHAVRNAEWSWLRAHAPLAWAARRSAALPLAAKLGVAFAVLLAVAAGAAYELSQRSGANQRPHADNPAFRMVSRHVDQKTRVPVYEGYVQSYGDLAALAISARSTERAPVLRVLVLDQLRDQLRGFLDKYYRRAQLDAAQPGAFTVTLPAEDGYLLPESWDYRRVARLARAEIDGLQALKFAGQKSADPASGDTKSGDVAQADGPVRIPLEAIGMNLVRSSHGAWLADQQGAMYFAGARLRIGKLTQVSECLAVVVRDDDGSVYEFFTKGGTGGGKC